MRERLEGKQYVEKYVQNLAHEMKSPLTAVIGAAEILENNLPTADSIGEQARRRQAIIKRMLMLDRVEQLQPPEGIATVDLEKTLKTAIALRRQQLDARQLACQLSTDAAPSIRGDAFLLQQAILNLLDNAIESAPAGSRIEIGLASAEGQAAITVRGHGQSAPDYALPQPFDRFYSPPRPATGRKSTGLGLALVREVARLHGGEAGFENHPAGGGLAHIRGPLA